MKVLVAVTMLPPSEGGRKDPLVGGKYSPTTVVEKAGNAHHYSIVLDLIDRDDSGVWYALGGFIFEKAAPTDLLYPDNELPLYEGPHLIGHLRVLTPASVVSELLAVTR